MKVVLEYNDFADEFILFFNGHAIPLPGCTEAIQHADSMPLPKYRDGATQGEVFAAMDTARRIKRRF